MYDDNNDEVLLSTRQINKQSYNKLTRKYIHQVIYLYPLTQSLTFSTIIKKYLF